MKIGVKRNTMDRRFSGQQGIANGCLIAIVLTLVFVVGAVVYVVTHIKDWTAEGAAAAMTLVIEQSGIPEQEKGEIIDIVEQLKEDFKKGLIGLEDLQQVALAFAEDSPILPMAAVYQFESDYLDYSGLANEEKAAAGRLLNRLMYGLSTGMIAGDTVSELSERLKATDEEGDRVFRDPADVSDDEIRAILVDIRRTVDLAGIPNDTVAIDISEEFKKVVANALGTTV